MQRMAEHLGVHHQQLQQFMMSSTWLVQDVRSRPAWRAVASVRPQVWMVDNPGFPMSWRLFLPSAWDRPEAAVRQRACRTPETEHHRPKWQLALDMLDELAATGLRPAVLVADTGYGTNADFRRSLEDHGLAYVLQTKGEMTAHGEEAVPHQPAYGRLGPRPLPRYRTCQHCLLHEQESTTLDVELPVCVLGDQPCRACGLLADLFRRRPAVLVHGLAESVTVPCSQPAPNQLFGEMIAVGTD